MEQISHITNFMSDEASTVRKATVDEAAPTPGYLYNELIVLCQKSSASSALLVDLLVKRLNTGVSTHPKYKALNCMKHLAQKGPADFAEVLRQKIDIIRSYKNYRAEPDPVKGDAYNNMVRIAAQAVEEILSSEQTFKRPLSSSTIATQSISSGLSDSDPSFGAAAWEKVKSIVPSIGSKGAIEAGDSRQDGSTTSSRWSFSGAVDFISSIRRSKTDDTTYTNPDTSTTNTIARTPEERLIDAAIINPNTRVTPPSESIKLFNTYSESLNKKKLARLLLRTLENPDWQVRLKCLYYIDGLLKHQEKIYKPIFSRSSDYIEDTLQTPQASVRDKAKKVMKRLNGESDGSEDENDSSDEEGGKSKQTKKKSTKPRKESSSESDESGDSDEADDSELSDFYKESDSTELTSDDSEESEKEYTRKPKTTPQKPSVKFASPDESDESEENTKARGKARGKGKGKTAHSSDDSEDEKKPVGPLKKSGKGKAASKKVSSSEESSEEDIETRPTPKSKGKTRPAPKSKAKKESSSDDEQAERTRPHKLKGKAKVASKMKQEFSSDSDDDSEEEKEEEKGKKQPPIPKTKGKSKNKQAQPPKAKSKKEISSDDEDDDEEEEEEKVEVKPRLKSKSTSSVDTKKATKDTVTSSKGKGTKGKAPEVEPEPEPKANRKGVAKKSAASGNALDELFGESKPTAIANDVDSLLTQAPQQRNTPPPGARVSSVVLNPQAPMHPNYSVNTGLAPVGMGHIQPGALVPYGMQMQGMMQPGMSSYPNAYPNAYPYPGINQGAFRPNPY